jgi:tetratricopeptide (TPR) repeat protein
VWITGPWTDLLIGCGGWSIPLLLASYTLVDRDVPRWSAVFYGLALVCNYPHYMATIYRAYRGDDRGRYRLYTHYLTAVLVVVGVIAHARFQLVPWLFTTYVLWSPWHYTGQNFGLLMMFLRRAGLDVSTAERGRLHAAFVASYVLLIAAFNNGPSHDPLVLSLALPNWIAQPVELLAALVFVLAGGSAFWSLARRAPTRALMPPLTLYSTQALWFVLPIALSWASSLSVPQTRYSSGMIAVMHSAQYLWITRYFAARDAATESPASPWSARAYWATLITGGIALFLPIPWLASYGWHADFTASAFIVASIVNIHHFMIDGVVWKLRNPRVGQLLVQSSVRSSDRLVTLPAPRPAWRNHRVVAIGGRVAAVVALLALALVDQWRYGLAAGHSDPDRLIRATAINPYDSGAYLRLAQAEGKAGRTDAAESALRRAMSISPDNPSPARSLVRLLIEANRLADAYPIAESAAARWPGDVDMLVNAGVLAFRLGNAGAAEQWWRRALERDATQLQVHGYLAGILEQRGDIRAALPHYRAYLELSAAASPDERPAPGAIVPVVIKFGDALAHEGERDAARLQYDLAIRMAQQTGLADVEALARDRQAALTAQR